jgi:hypothetical protein
MSDVSAEDIALLNAAFDKLANGICPHCDTTIEHERQVGRCVYGEPCGCRLYQGTAGLAQQLGGEG